MIGRDLQSKAIELAQKYPFVVITGPRQSGKSTLARLAFPEYKTVSLEDLDNRAFAEEDTRGFISTYPDKTIIDEVQRVPSLLSYLQTHCDNEGKEGMYILTGSQNIELMQSVDQSLAGRVGLIHLLPFSKKELNDANMLGNGIDAMILKGFYPRIYDKNIPAYDYYQNYVRTYVERDVRNIKNITDLSRFVRFLKLCAARVGQLLNMSALANDCGISVPTVEQWLSVLETSFVIYRLKPDWQNYSKRLVKTPKLYFYDTGIVCSLLDIRTEDQLHTHYLRGNLFENMVVTDYIKGLYNKGELEPDITFWRDSTGHEVDMIIRKPEGVYAYEIKSSETFNESFLDGLRFWGKLSGADGQHKSVIYAGKRIENRSDAIILPFD